MLSWYFCVDPTLKHSSRPSSSYGIRTLITLLLATLLLLLFWFVLDRAPRNVWIAAIYLLTGLFIVVSPEIYFTPALGWLIPQFMIASVLSFPSYMLFAGGFVAIMGLFILILPSRERMVSQ